MTTDHHRFALSMALLSIAFAPAVFAREATAAPPPDGPWRAHDALGLPPWLRVGLENRLRFEHLDNDFRSTATASSTALFSRTLLAAELQLAPLVVGTARGRRADPAFLYTQVTGTI